MKPEPETLIDIIESFKERDKTALIHKNGFRTFRYSYADLYSAIRKCASWYQAQGLKPGDSVLLWGPNQPEWVIAFLGAVYADLVVVPADLLSTHDAVEKIAKRAHVSLIVQTKFKKPLALDIPNHTMEYLQYDIENAQTYERTKEVDKTALIELVFTSGTTGNPKGVKLTHENITSNIGALLSVQQLSEHDEALSLLPMSHMLEQTVGLLTPLTIGMSIVYVPAITATNIFRAFDEEHVSVMVCVPRILQSIRRGILAKVAEQGKTETFNRLLEQADTMPPWVKRFVFGRIHKRLGKTFRWFATGGAPLDPDTELFWKRIGVKVQQGYGLTECSPILTVTGEDTIVPGSVGRALSNVELRISPKGEVQAKGPNIFSGYFEDEEKTKESFDDGWYKTEDIGLIDEHGQLFLRGRKKDMILTASGKNVYPDDIESVLNEIPGVRESCVVGVPGDGGEEIHGVILLDDTELSVDSVMASANGELDSSQRVYAMSIWHEPEFPKTSTQKIKRNIVREYVQNNTESKTGRVSTYSKLQGLLAQVTGKSTDQISAEKKLYGDLGLDSIGRVELLTLISREYNLDLDEEQIGEQTSVGELDALITAGAKTSSAMTYPSWPHRRGLWLVRMLGIELFFLNVNRLFVTLTTSGTENLEGLNGPVMFVANHVGFADHSTIMRALPARFKYHVAAPAKAEFFDGTTGGRLWRLWTWFAYYGGALFLSAYKMSEFHSIKRGLEHSGFVVDQGQSLIIFPEGRHTTIDGMEPFTKGAALLVQALKIPVVPIGHAGLEKIYSHTVKTPTRGAATLKIGKPMYFTKESVEEITRRLEDEVRELAGQG